MTTDISVGVRWDPLNQDGQQEGEFEFDYDGGNSSSRLFERSRIKALAGEFGLYVGNPHLVVQKGYLGPVFAHLSRLLISCSKRLGHFIQKKKSCIPRKKNSVSRRTVCIASCSFSLLLAGSEKGRGVGRSFEFIILETDNRARWGGGHC